MDVKEVIPEHHLVRVVNQAVNRLDDVIFDAAYPGGGRDSFLKALSIRRKFYLWERTAPLGFLYIIARAIISLIIPGYIRM